MGKKEIEALRKVLKSLEEDEPTDKPTDEVDAPEGEPESEPEQSEEELEKAAKKVANMVSKELNLDKIEKLINILEKEDKSMTINDMIDGKSVEKQIDSLTKEEKIVAFTKALLQRNDRVVKALSEGTAADGGNLFPNEFRFEIVKRLIQQPRMRSLVTVIPMRRDIIDIPTEGAKSTVSWGSENTAITTTTADFGTKQITAYRLNSIMYASRELVNDATEIGIVNLIIDQFADAIGEEEDKVIIQGSGSGQPTGLTGTSGHHTVAEDGNLSFDSLINVFYALPQQYRNQAVWLVNTENVRELRKLKDSQNRYLWIDSPVPGTPATILGRPVVENTWVPVSSIFFGDLKRAYFLGDREQMSVETTTEAGDTWSKHQIGIKVTERIGGTVVLEDALAELTSVP